MLIRIALVVAGLGMMLAALILRENLGFSGVPTPLGRSSLRVVSEELFPRSQLKEFFVADGKLYLYYENAGLVNVYTPEGEYLYGFCYRQDNAGAAFAVYDEGKLYILSRTGALFCTEGKEIIYGAIAPELRKKQYELSVLDDQPKNHAYQGNVFIASEAGDIILKHSDGTRTTIIHAPQNGLIGPLSLIGMLMMFAGLPSARKSGKSHLCENERFGISIG